MIAGLAVTGAVVVVDRAGEGSPPAARDVIGLVGTWIGVSVLNDVAPRLAAPVALLIVAGIVLQRGGGALAAISRTVATPPTLADVGKVAHTEATAAAIGHPLQLEPANGPNLAVRGAIGPSPLVPIPASYVSGGAERILAAVLPAVVQVCDQMHVKVSDGYRPPGDHPAGGAGESSDHRKGTAADFVPWSATFQQWAEQQQRAGRFPYVEPASLAGFSHVHISFNRTSPTLQVR